jgi:2-amino-4-hydroxy-6-hydroxymethyldihydropteridine diphosphokinase
VPVNQVEFQVTRSRVLESVQRAPVRAFIGIGANLGDAESTVLHAIRTVGELHGISVERQSSLYSSEPVDSCGPDYVNAVIECQSILTAPQLLRALQTIELHFGRERPYRNAPRTLDLDLLRYGQAQIQSADLTVPHPRMWERAFVVLPLAEIAPQEVDSHQLVRVRNQVVHRRPLSPSFCRA